MTTPHVVPILATPFGVVSLPGAEKLNPSLCALFDRRAAMDAARAQNPLCYRSADDLLEWTDPPVPELAEELLRGVCAVVSAVNDFPAGQLASFKLQARGWFTIVRPNGAVPGVTHPLTAWCGVYCVAAPQRSQSRHDSGALRLYESRLGTMFSDATNSVMRVPFTPGHYAWLPVPGQLAVFPASINHEIALLRAPAPLVLVTVRARFVAPGQSGWATW